MTISLAIADRNNLQQQIGILLLHAFNSIRFFAFCERAFFATPYYFGKVGLKESTPCLMNAWSNDRNVIRAEMSEEERLTNEADDDWEGIVVIPDKQKQLPKYFVAKLSGKTRICEFSGGSDQVRLQSDPKYPVFEWLISSAFTAKEWQMRSNAFHAKSKTYSF